jgi:hypothetical protein
MSAAQQHSWPKPDSALIKRFLDLLGKPQGTCRLRAFFPSGDPRKDDDKGRKGNGMPSLIEEWQREGRGVYVVINDGGDTDAEITDCTALFCEWDDRPADWQKTAWMELGLPEPTMQVATGGKSIHSYWVLREPLAPDQWRELQRRLLDHAKADRSCKNPSRVMRLPGCWYMHFKDQPGEMVRIINEGGSRYSAAVIEDCLPALPPSRPAPAPQLQSSEGVHLRELLPRDLEQLAKQGAQEGSRNEDCFRLAASAVAIAKAAAAAGLRVVGTPETVVLGFAASCSPPLPEREALSCLQSAGSKNPSPDPGWPERLRYQLNRTAEHADRHRQQPEAARTQERQSEIVPDPQANGEQPSSKPHTITAKQKLQALQQLAIKLQADKVPFADRLPTLRHKAQELIINVRDAELIGMLTAARRRRLGSDGLLGPGERLDLTPQPWACSGLILRGCLNLLVALPKQGKTSLIVALIAAWHHGAGAFLDRPLQGPCPPVLLIGTDQGQADWGRLLQPAGLVDGHGTILPPIIGLAHAGHPVHLDPEGIDQIADYAQRHPGLFVLIDSLAACIAPLGLKEESPEIAMPVAELMEQLEPHGATVVLIHHASKGRAGEGATSASRGSTALPALASQILKLGPATPNNPRDNRRVLTTEGRGGLPQSLVIERKGSGWLLHGGVETLERERDQAKTISNLSKPQEDCLELVLERWQEDLQRTTANDVVAGLAIVNKDPQSSAARTLQQLKRKGLVESIRQRGEFGRRGAYAFRPTSDTLATLSRGGQKNSVGSVGSVGCGALACEDPERDNYLNPSSEHTSGTTGTTGTHSGGPTRGLQKVSEVGVEVAGASAAVVEAQAMPSPAWLRHLLALHDQGPHRHPNSLAGLLKAHHGVDTNGREVQDLLKQFRAGNDHQLEAAE